MDRQWQAGLVARTPRFFTRLNFYRLCRHRLVARTPRFQCGNPGSIPGGGKNLGGQDVVTGVSARGGPRLYVGAIPGGATKKRIPTGNSFWIIYYVN